MQKSEFTKDIKIVQKDKGPLKGSLLRLSPSIDTVGPLRVGGRLRNAPIPYSAKYQLILPQRHHLTKILIRQIHEDNGHAGPEYTLSELRQRYWIIGGRSTVRHVLHNCLHCKKLKAQPSVPKMADLPDFRVTANEPPFSRTGVDYFGPLYVKRGRSILNRWGCIFTCLVMRAVHLEVSESSETDAFINTLERFMNQHGYPSMMASDCGSNFKGADKELRECLKALDHNKIQAFAGRKKMAWKYNPPSSPHIGGAWERLVRSVKTTMKAILKNRTVDDFTLMTVFTEAESIVNSRPLTAVNDDINDFEALTPNHFLIGRAFSNMAPGNFTEKDIDNRKRWRQVQIFTEHIWRRFQREYLPHLTEHSKRASTGRRVQEGDLVLLTDSNASRGKWPLARAIRTFQGQEGAVRVAGVRTSAGVYTRPVAKLCVLEEKRFSKNNVLQGGEDVGSIGKLTLTKHTCV